MLVALSATMPLTFILLFFGYLPPRFDVVIYTDNIKGEGTCASYLSSPNETFAYLYYADAYFGSQLKTLKMQDLRYDIDMVSLYLYDIEEADILSYDIGVFGYTVLHHNSEGDKRVLHPITKEAISSDEVPIAHIINENPQNSFEVNFTKSIGIPAWVWIVYFSFLILVAIILALGLTYLTQRKPKLMRPLLGISSLFATMVMGCLICGSLPYVNYTDFLLNWLLLYAVSLLLGAVTVRWIGTAVVSVFTIGWYIADYFVIAFRNKPIMPADLKATGTAREVIGGYNLTPTREMLLGIVIVTIYIVLTLSADHILGYYRNKEPIKKKLLHRGITIAISVVLIVFGVNNSAFKALNSFQWDARVLEGFHREGIVLTYIKSAMSAHVKKPEGYSREKVADYLKEYKAASNPDNNDVIHPSRIIMIMNEAFSDLRVAGMNNQIDVMPFIDNLKDNTIQGSLFTSVLGGGTCNTEFEALTGNSLSFFGPGAYPYTENITAPRFSIASYFQNEDYYTVAFHANKASNWNRNIVYPNLGFEEFISIEKYPELTENDFLHLHVSDQTDYRVIEDEDDKYLGKPRFFFDVTIQNHADYDRFDDVVEAESVKKYGSDLDQSARVYLSLIKASDDAIKTMVEKYRNSKEPTMIIFFGDHQPYLGEEAHEQVYAGITSFLDFFRTKFFVWTNYETKPVENLGISANYLPWLILERGNFPLPPYVQMLKEIYEAYPILTSQGVISAEGELYDNVAELYGDPLIQKYQYIQYANLFDEIDPAWFEVQ